MNKLRASIIAVATLLSSVCADAAITSGYGAAAEARTFPNCAVLCPGPAGTDETNFAGGEFATGATATVDNSTATGFASVSFTGDAFTPLLRAAATSPVTGSTAGDGKATAIQSYTFTGTAPMDFSIFAELHGTILEPDGNSEAKIEGRVAVYIWDNAEFATDYSSFIFETVPLSGGEVLANKQLFLNPSLDLSSATLDFTLNPGDEAYVFAQLFAKGERGGSANAINTFDMSFTAGDTATLQAMIAPVPLPGPLWLLGSALLMIASSRYQKHC
jgi:hypothetical protein